jgi:uncharacterized protein with HEPN domain
MSRDSATLVDIAEAARRATRFTAGLDAASFFGNEEKRWAVFSQIVIIGEAAARLSAEFQEAHTQIPWKQIVGMRHRLVHGYDQINWRRVWETATHDLPALLAAITPLLPTEEG